MALYQEIIIDHGRKPRFFFKPECYTCDEEAFNPLCGDKVHLYADVKDGMVKNISFEGQGCAISMASTSLMLEIMQGRTFTEIRVLFNNFHQMIVQNKAFDREYEEILEKIAILKGVQQYPSRVKCATLAWHALDLMIKKHEANHGSAI